MRTKNAQMIGQIFIFIIAGLLFVLILMYGYRAISGFMQRGEEVQLLDFRNALDSAVTTIKQDYGSVQRVDLRVPAKTEKVCLVNPSTASAGSLENDYPLLYSAWQTGSENVFLIPRQPTPILIPDILVETGYVCVSAINGRVSFRVEGLGNKAKISAWQT